MFAAIGRLRRPVPIHVQGSQRGLGQEGAELGSVCTARAAGVRVV